MNTIAMEAENIRKEYSNGEVTIIWQPGKCIHAGKCVGGNPDVFQPKEKPWIKPQGARTEKIIETVRNALPAL